MYWLEQQPASIPSVYSTLARGPLRDPHRDRARRLGDAQDLPEPARELDLDRRLRSSCSARSSCCGRTRRAAARPRRDEPPRSGSLLVALALLRGRGDPRERAARERARTSRRAPAAIRGRVVHAEGGPAAGVEVAALRAARERAARAASRNERAGRPLRVRGHRRTTRPRPTSSARATRGSRTRARACSSPRASASARSRCASTRPPRRWARRSCASSACASTGPARGSR